MRGGRKVREEKEGKNPAQEGRGWRIKNSDSASAEGRVRAEDKERCRGMKVKEIEGVVFVPYTPNSKLDLS